MRLDRSRTVIESCSFIERWVLELCEQRGRSSQVKFPDSTGAGEVA